MMRHAPLLSLACLACSAAAAQPAATAAEVAVHLDDAGPIEARGATRDLPLKLYLPDAQAYPEPCAVVLVSHGLGGSRDGMVFLGEAFAGHGYVAVHLQHVGSDRSVWEGVPPRDRLRALRGAMGLEPWRRRVEDVSATLDHLAALPADHPAHGRVDLDRVGIAGHSFGAHTAMAMAGQRYGRSERAARSVRDDRIDAVVAYSPSPPERNREVAYGAIATPILHMTGTEDESMVNDTTAADRLLPFELIPESAPDQYRVVFEGGDHAVFAGTRWPGAGPTTPEQDAVFHALTIDATLTFFDAYLRNDAEARADLREGYAERLGDHGTFDMK